MLRKLGGCQSLADSVVADVGNLAETIEKAEGLKDGRINANANVRVSGLYPLQGRTGREGTLRHDRHRQSSTPTSIIDIRT